MNRLRGRSVLTVGDFTGAEILDLVRLGAELKAAKRGGYEVQRLKGKALALIFEKDSTRTRSGFEIAAYDQGAHVTYMGPGGSHIGHKESSRTPRGFSAACTMRSSFAASRNPMWRRWRVMPVCRSIMG